MGHGDMGNKAGAEEAFLAGERAVDELVGHHEGAGRQLFLQRAAGRHRDHVGDADALEGIYQNLEEVSRSVLQKDISDQDAAASLNAMAREEDLNGRIRRNMMDTRRAVSFLMRGRLLNAEQFDDARQILRDIESLDGHTAFLFDKINFLMDATVGFININQNKIIKIFSVASVAFLPPTLIASIYGMNFRLFPELNWDWGYPFALVLMVASAITPFWYFRRRGWLK